MQVGLLALLLLLSSGAIQSSQPPPPPHLPEAWENFGCQCSTTMNCNNCCHVRDDAGTLYGPHCRMGVCGAGAFPSDHTKKWDKKTSPTDPQWGKYWECPPGGRKPKDEDL